jgi:hypothetical protein
LRRNKRSAFLVTGASALALAACGFVTNFDRSRIPGANEDGGLDVIDAPIGDAGVVTLSDAAPLACPIPVDAASLNGWRPPQLTYVACTQAEIATLQAIAADAGPNFAELYGLVSPSCQACLFSSPGDPQWQPFLWQADMQSGQAIANDGTCLAGLGDNVCAKAEYEYGRCLEYACPGGCVAATGSTQATCYEQAAGECTALALRNTTPGVCRLEPRSPADCINAICGDLVPHDAGPDCAPQCPSQDSTFVLVSSYPLHCVGGDPGAIVQFCGGALLPDAGCGFPGPQPAGGQLSDGGGSFECLFHPPAVTSPARH